MFGIDPDNNAPPNPWRKLSQAWGRLMQNSRRRITLISLVIFIPCMVAGFFGMQVFFPSAEEELPEGRSVPTRVAINGERTNILFLGIDAREGETVARADTIILASIDPDTKRAAVLSIPRDTRATINRDSDQKISYGTVYGGVELMVELVEEMLGEEINYYVMMDFSGFEALIEVLGGVTIDVEGRKYKPSEGIDLQPGLQRLNGHDALGYVRFRDYSMGDIERTVAQQKFIQALKSEILQAKTIIKIPQLISQIDSLTDTNMTIGDMLKMSRWIKLFEGDTLTTQTLPGYFYDVRDEYGNLLNSFWQTDDQTNKTLMEKLLQGETVDMILPASDKQSVKVISSGVVEVNDTEEEVTGGVENQSPSSTGGEKPSTDTDNSDTGTAPPETPDSESPTSLPIDIPVLDDESGTAETPAGDAEAELGRSDSEELDSTSSPGNSTEMEQEIIP